MIVMQAHRYVVSADSDAPRKRCNSKHCKYTSMSFTAADSNLAMLAVIVEGNSLTCGEKHGEDFTKKQINAEEGSEINEVLLNTGKDKFYPSRYTAIHNGKHVPIFGGCLEHGGITPELLRKMLERFDKLEVFDRSVAIPFLLLDKHGSRFDFLFLEYIKKPATKQYVCIGVPYGTHAWQLGNSVE